MNSNPASKLMPEELLSKTHTGNLLDNLEMAMQVEVLDSRYMKLSYQENPIQKELTYTQQLLDPRWKGKADTLIGYLNNLKPDHVWKTYNDSVVCG